MRSKAKVLNFEKGASQWGYAVKGRAGRQYRRDTAFGGYYNGNGQWRSYPEPYFSAVLRVFKPYPHIEIIDIRKYALKASGRTKITDRYVQAVRAANCKKIINVYVDEDDETEICNIYKQLDLVF